MRELHLECLALVQDTPIAETPTQMTNSFFALPKHIMNIKDLKNMQTFMDFETITALSNASAQTGITIPLTTRSSKRKHRGSNMHYRGILVACPVT